MTTPQQLTPSPPPLLVVMGVSGSGKSTVGTALAAALGVPFIDGDDLHPPDNIEKMTRGTPLDDLDRGPWLRTVGDRFASAESDGHGLVIACSALKLSYRDIIRLGSPRVSFVELKVPRDALLQRVSARPEHFMPPALLDSQLAIVQHLGAQERGLQLDYRLAVSDLVSAVLSALAAGE
jgi:gluconokinase